MVEDEERCFSDTGFWHIVAPSYDGPDNVADPDSAAYGHWVLDTATT